MGDLEGSCIPSFLLMKTSHERPPFLRMSMWLDGKQQFTCFSQVPVNCPCIVQPFSTFSPDSELDEVTGVDDEDDDTVRQSLQVYHYVLIIKS